MTDKKVPELRFEGFENEWEQRKLGEVFQQTVEYIDPKEAGLELWSVTVENGLTPKSERYNREFLVKKNDKFKAIHPDEIVYNPMNMTLGSIGFNNSGKDVAVSGYYVTMKLKKEFDSKYFATWLPSPNAINLYKLYATGSLIERQRVQFPTLSGIRTLMPSLDEQNQIGSFFTSLDDTITLHQRKIDLLKQLKQAYLKKLFPVNGETVPELRFTDFEEEWEQRKFSDIVIRVNKSSNSNSLPKVEFEDIVAGEGRLNKDVTKKFDSRKGVEFLPEDILYGKLRPYLKNWLKPSFKGVALGDFWVLRTDGTDSNFMYSLIQSDKYQKVANDTSGTKMPRSDWKKVSRTEFFIPLNLNEQKQIGVFFKQLDNTITLHQNKLDQLKKIKSDILQKMFI